MGSSSARVGRVVAVAVAVAGLRAGTAGAAPAHAEPVVEVAPTADVAPVADVAPAADVARPDWKAVGEDEAALVRVRSGGDPPARLIYLNDCKAGGGCRVRPGREDARTNHSTWAQRPARLAPFGHSALIWARTLACVKKTYARFDIHVTDVDPCPDPDAGCTTPHWETMVAGNYEDLGYVSQGGPTYGVSVIDVRGCRVTANSMSFVFADAVGGDDERLCWYIAHETAHAFGLEHLVVAADPMTYLQNPRHKEFQDLEMQCGTNTVQPCLCGDARRNSVRELLAIFGPAPPSPPVVTILEPVAGAAVEPGFPVRVALEDEQGIGQVELIVDGASVAVATAPPFSFNAPAALAAGPHRVEVRATDVNGTPGAAAIDVRIGACAPPEDCGSPDGGDGGGGGDGDGGCGCASGGDGAPGRDGAAGASIGVGLAVVALRRRGRSRRRSST